MALIALNTSALNDSSHAATDGHAAKSCRLSPGGHATSSSESIVATASHSTVRA
jgi:hypothetical protein